MNRQDMIHKALDAILDKHAPSTRMTARGTASRLKQRDRFITGLDAIEGDIRADECARIVKYLREEADKRGTTPMAEELSDAADVIERGLHRESS